MEQELFVIRKMCLNVLGEGHRSSIEGPKTTITYAVNHWTFIRLKGKKMWNFRTCFLNCYWQTKQLELFLQAHLKYSEKVCCLNDVIKKRKSEKSYNYCPKATKNDINGYCKNIKMVAFYSRLYLWLLMGHSNIKQELLFYTGSIESYQT